MTLPQCIIEAIEREFADLDLTAGDGVKHWLTAAYTQPAGVSINLTKVDKAPMPDNQPELPLT